MGSIPERSASSLMHGSTKTTVKTVVFLTPTWNRTAVGTARFPYARQARCYTGVPNDCEDSRFYMMKRKG